MNTMTMPGFVAERSLYKTSGRYRSLASRGYSGRDVVSQMRVGGGGLGGSGGLSEWCWTPSCCIQELCEPGPTGIVCWCAVWADCPYQYCVGW
jgi:hypothetical protein